MGLVPSYQHDVFISYAWEDNVAQESGLPGWVTSFVERLFKAIDYNLRDARGDRSADIFFDRERMISGPVSQQLEHRVKNSATFLMFLSPSYIKSDYCMNEYQWFREQVEAGSAQEPSDAPTWPLFVAAMSEGGQESWPQSIKDWCYVPFCRQDMTHRSVRFCDPHIYQQHPDYPAYDAAFMRLAAQLSERLRRAMAHARQANGQGRAEQPPIQVAISHREEPDAADQLDGKRLLVLGTEDLDEQMSQVDDALSARGCQVKRPDFDEYRGMIDNIKAVVGNYDACLLMLGLFATRESMSLLQAAYDAAQTIALPTFPWTESAEDLERLFAKRRLPEYRRLVDITGVNDHKVSVDDLIAEIEERLSAQEIEIDTADEPFTIELFVDGDQDDLELVHEIEQRMRQPNVRDRLSRAGLRLDFAYPTPSESQAQHHASLKELLSSCHGIAIVYGHENPMALKARVSDHRKHIARRGRSGGSKPSITIHNGPQPKRIRFSFNDEYWLDLASEDYAEKFLKCILDLARERRQVEDV